VSPFTIPFDLSFNVALTVTTEAPSVCKVGESTVSES
ncbi:MAG: hypothetical protein RLZZ220_60, partial [Pseudomonadota bacterium]